METVVYTVDGKSNRLSKVQDSYTGSQIAPEIPGVYDGIVKVTRDGLSTVISSNDPRFSFALIVDDEPNRIIHLKQYLPEFMTEIKEFKALLDTEEKELDDVKHMIAQSVDNTFIDTSDEDTIERIEKFLAVRPSGTLKQRKDYLKALYLNGVKTNKSRIEEIVKNITGGEVLMKFYTSDQPDNPSPGYGYLEVKVLSPSIDKDYNFDNVSRTIKPLISAHIKLSILKWFATWDDIKQAYTSWETIKTNAESWDSIYTYTPPR